MTFLQFSRGLFFYIICFFNLRHFLINLFERILWDWWRILGYLLYATNAIVLFAFLAAKNLFSKLYKLGAEFTEQIAAHHYLSIWLFQNVIIRANVSFCFYFFWVVGIKIGFFKLFWITLLEVGVRYVDCENGLLLTSFFAWVSWILGRKRFLNLRFMEILLFVCFYFLI